jgi:hypothetical protein
LVTQPVADIVEAPLETSYRRRVGCRHGHDGVLVVRVQQGLPVVAVVNFKILFLKKNRKKSVNSRKCQFSVKNRCQKKLKMCESNAN